MWILLTKKLPTNPSPPKLSIFWSDPWIDEKYVLNQFHRLHGNYKSSNLPQEFYLDQDGKKMDDVTLKTKMIAFMQVKEETYIVDEAFEFRGGGREHNWAKARSIIYKGEKIRVFEEEFSILKHENMSLYLGFDGESQSHDLIPDNVSSEKIMSEVMTGSLKDIYDAALVEGCTPVQAQATALGIDFEPTVSEADLATYPAIGWYKCRPEYAQLYCEEYEMKE